MYADDTQVSADRATTLTANIADCVEAATPWMRSNMLQPNPDKTEFLWYATVRRQHQLPATPLLIDGCSITPVQSARDLGIYVYCDLSMRTHVQRTVSRCFAALRQLRPIRRSVPLATLQMPVVALVHFRLNYGNGVGVLVGLPSHVMRRLQSVLNAAARLIYLLRTRDHITDALISLQWLRIKERIQYKLAILAYRVLHGDAPRYLGPLIRVDDLPGRRPLRSTNTNRPRGTASETVDNRQSSFYGRGSRYLEQTANDVVTANSLSTFRRLLKRFFIPAIISWCSLLTSPNQWSLQWLCHFKN